MYAFLPKSVANLMTWPVQYPSQCPNERIFRKSNDSASARSNAPASQRVSTPMNAFLAKSKDLATQSVHHLMPQPSQYSNERIFAQSNDSMPNEHIFRKSNGSVSKSVANLIMASQSKVSTK
jgi:hypothetical protein